jgi:hypothetical protein
MPTRTPIPDLVYSPLLLEVQQLGLINLSDQQAYDARRFFARQSSGTVSFNLLAADLDIAAMFALTAPVLKGAFEALHLQFVPCPWIAYQL